MSVDQIVAEAASLPEDQRKALISRLLEIGREERDAEFRRTQVPAKGAPEQSLFERLQSLSVYDPESPTDLATRRTI